MVRPINQIVDDVKKAKKIITLIELWNEIVKNKRKYTITEIINAIKEIQKKILIVEGSDIVRGHFFLTLESIYNRILINAN